GLPDRFDRLVPVAAPARGGRETGRRLRPRRGAERTEGRDGGLSIAAACGLAIMRIAYITAGAAGMFCGSCLHDNTLVTALRGLGHDALLIPTYTPIRTDEVDVSGPRIFFGGINVYLQQKFSLFRHTPWFLDRLLDGPRLLNWVSRFAVKTRAEDLGELTVSMLEGEHGRQRKEV